MSLKLEVVHDESVATDGRQGGQGSRREDPFADDSMRLIAALWEWAAFRELGAAYGS